MAAKTAHNGVITLAHQDTVAKGGNNRAIMGATLSDATSGVTCTLYTGTAATAANAIFSVVTPVAYEPIDIHLYGAPSTGAGLLFEGDGVTCYLDVR